MRWKWLIISETTTVWNDNWYCSHLNKVETRLCVSLTKLILPGDNCRVRDPRTGYEFDLSSLKGKDYPVRNDKYIYHLSVCGPLQRGICTHINTSNDTVASCQVDGTKEKIGGTEFTNKKPLSYICQFDSVWINQYHYSRIDPLCAVTYVQDWRTKSWVLLENSSSWTTQMEIPVIGSTRDPQRFTSPATVTDTLWVSHSWSWSAYLVIISTK